MSEELWSIGEVARRIGVRPSAIRYYEERGLLAPARRVGGKRRYGIAELRRLAFIRMLQSVGLRLDEIAVVLGGRDPRGRGWRDVVEERVAALEERIAEAERAKAFLSSALRCRADHPAVSCPYVRRILDERIAELND
ncbi:hypothetical protein TH66_17375 [Carbonactinospora thermoautotrophica]|uniref:Transcriptional regulator n=1 Tax=Carbonactinospora thermoautotrophica TaxID=1469144 RepID=A0A132NIF7_9ACTN|nr:MerR family transcriptional regulator [Carbonactinospora thermoautotrophica]KWW97430.1 hypothetical protein TH66_17375 [Carbonactinospora thermoautotrophica]KWW98680.1 Transcriptional regulator [Carbonactinospora thermoautotrophica]KWX09910.1 hypothetical protein TR74_06780 [Carbonactinospora thermoautotrophica]